MQVQKSSRNIGIWSVAASLAAVFALGGVGTALAEDTTSTGNRVFFRGGAAGLTSDRGGELITDGHGAVGKNDGSFGYYIGGGTDLMVTRDLWGMMNGVAVVGEIGLEFKRWASANVANGDTALPPGPGGVTGVSNGGLSKVQLTMLTVSVAPKVKFRQGTDFQPWIIPAGLDFHVIGPMSSQINYLDIGVQFGGALSFACGKSCGWVSTAASTWPPIKPTR